MMKTMFASMACSLALIASAAAQTGPVAVQCKDDIAKLCASETHNGRVRFCLEDNHDKISKACQQALDTTGGGRGKGMGKNN